MLGSGKGVLVEDDGGLGSCLRYLLRGILGVMESGNYQLKSIPRQDHIEAAPLSKYGGAWGCDWWERAAVMQAHRDWARQGQVYASVGAVFTENRLPSISAAP